MPKEKNYRTKYGRSKPKKSRKPLFLIVGGAVLLIIALVFALQTPQTATGTPGGAPELKTDKAFVDLGDKALGSIARVTFKLSNAGDSTLRFTKDPYVEVKEGC